MGMSFMLWLGWMGLMMCNLLTTAVSKNFLIIIRERKGESQPSSACVVIRETYTG